MVRQRHGRHDAAHRLLREQVDLRHARRNSPVAACSIRMTGSSITSPNLRRQSMPVARSGISWTMAVGIAFNEDYEDPQGDVVSHRQAAGGGSTSARGTP